MNIKKHLPKPVERRLIQARIDRKIYDKITAQLKKDGVSIQDFFEAAAKSYMEAL